jgi:hypothetical protein
MLLVGWVTHGVGWLCKALVGLMVHAVGWRWGGHVPQQVRGRPRRMLLVGSLDDACLHVSNPWQRHAPAGMHPAGIMHLLV